jgi:drug/metabolite transporter (DMT)-like permease
MNKGLLCIILLITAASLCDTVSQLIIKNIINSIKPSLRGIKNIALFILRIISTPVAWIGFSFSCLSLFIWLFVLSKADLNLAFSLDSMHYIFIALASGLILKEKVGSGRWLGTLLIVGGIVIVSLSTSP